MYEVSILFYSDAVPNGIMMQNFKGLSRENCIQQVIEYVNDVHWRTGDSVLKVKILSESKQ